MSVPGSNHDPALVNADRFARVGQFHAAVTEYKRFLFFNPGDPDLGHVYYQMSRCFSNMEHWTEASEALEQAVAAAGNDSLTEEWRLQSALLLLARGNYSGAELALLRIEAFGERPSVRNRALLLHGIAAIYRRQWEDAAAALNQYFDRCPDSSRQPAVMATLKRAQEYRYREASTARWLSVFVPGAGQVYAGDWTNGVNALALNGSLAAWIIYKVLNSYYSDALTIYFFLFRRYYAGNIYNAGRIAEQRTTTANREFGIELYRELVGE